MTPPWGAATAAHFALPWLLRRAAAGERGRRLRDPHVSGRVYDTATVVLAWMASREGAKGGWWLGMGTMAQLGARPGRESVVVTTAQVAVAEEMLWRRHRLWAVVPFALLHAPRDPRRWPYHLLTGTVFHFAARLGLPAAIAVHAGHNIVLERCRATGHEAQGLASEPSSAWPA